MEHNLSARYTGVRLPPDVKRRVRILAAEQGVSMAVMASRLIELGVTIFQPAVEEEVKA